MDVSVANFVIKHHQTLRVSNLQSVHLTHGGKWQPILQYLRDECELDPGLLGLDDLRDERGAGPYQAQDSDADADPIAEM